MPARIEQLAGRHRREGFDCTEPALNEFLVRLAGQQQRRGIGKTYVALAADGETVIGFVTLSAGQVATAGMPEALKLPRYPVPVLRIGRLAVDRGAQGCRAERAAVPPVGVHGGSPCGHPPCGPDCPLTVLHTSTEGKNMGNRFLNIARGAVYAIGLVAVQQCFATPIALQVSGQSLDVGGIFGVVGSPINLRFTVQYDTEQTDYDSWDGFGWYQPISYVGLSIKNSEGDDWLAESVNGDSLMIVAVSSYYGKLHQFYVSGMLAEPDRTPRGDSIIGVNLSLRDESLDSLVDETLPVPIEGLNHMQSASIAVIDGSYSAPTGGIFFLTDWTASAADLVVRAVPEPPMLGLILGALAGIRMLKRKCSNSRRTSIPPDFDRWFVNSKLAGKEQASASSAATNGNIRDGGMGSGLAFCGLDHKSAHIVQL